MKTRNKIVVDRLIGLPVAWFLNFCARILGWLLHRNHSCSRDQVRTVVFAKYVGMGSIIQATPLIRSVRAAYPEARIVFVTAKSCADLVGRLEHIDRVIPVDDSSIGQVLTTTLGAIFALMRARVDLFFDLEVYSSYASIVAAVSLARNRIGFFRESAEHKRGNYTHLMYFNTRHPIRHVYLQLGRLVDCEPVDPDRLGEIRVDDADRAEAAAELASNGIPAGAPSLEGRSAEGWAPYLVANPNASDLSSERRWPAPKFAELIGAAIEEYDLPVVVTGSRSESAFSRTVIELVPEAVRGRVTDLSGKLSIGGLLALLEGAKCLVTNDTGPMHMAWAINTPTVSLFGPCDPGQYGWSRANIRSIYKPIYCSPCVHEIDVPPCGGNNVCMQRIAVDDVRTALREILSGNSTGSHGDAEIAASFFVAEDQHPLGQVTRAG